NDKELFFREISEKPFVLSGFYWFDIEHKFCRLPEASLSEISDGVRQHAWRTSGGMVRFRSDSKLIAVHAELTNMVDMC
ncbi:MAG: hypothetical protein H8E46_01820, partial [FCB group bacterium]|nr:hypothetical protein [FCB group bacterium]